MLLVQADGGLGPIIPFVEKPEELPVIFPVPTGIGNMSEALVLDFPADIIQPREEAGRRGALGTQLFLFR